MHPDHNSAMVEIIYIGQTKIKEEDCANFLNILKKYKVLEGKFNQTNYLKSNVSFGTEVSVKRDSGVIMITQRRIARSTFSLVNVRKDTELFARIV